MLMVYKMTQSEIEARLNKSIEMNNTVFKTPVFIRLIRNINSV